MIISMQEKFPFTDHITKIMQTGTLNVYVNGSTNMLSWTLSGNQQNQWNQGQLPVPKMSTSYTVSILSLGLE